MSVARQGRQSATLSVRSSLFITSTPRSTCKRRDTSPSTPFVQWRSLSSRQAASKDPQDLPPLPTIPPSYIQLFIRAGATGTAALFLGWTLHVDPFGHFHLSWRDALIGFGFSLPIIILQTAAFKAEQPSEFLSKATADLHFNESNRATVDRNKSVRIGQQTMLLLAFVLYRSRLTAHRVLRNEPLWLLASLWLLGSVPMEMLLRGVALTSTGNYLRDRLLEANLGNFFLLMDVSADDVGKWCAVLITSSAFLTFIFAEAAKKRPKETPSVSRLLRMREVSGARKLMEGRNPTKIDKELLEYFCQSIDAGAKLSVVVESVLRLSSQIALFSSFIVTGNLFASLTTGAISFLTKYTLTSSEQQSRHWSRVREDRLSGPLSVSSARVVKTIQSEQYRRLKSLFLEKIQQAESNDSYTVAVDKTETKYEDEATSTERYGVSLDLDLSSLVLVFRITQNELARDLTIEDLDAKDREMLSNEKQDVDALIERAAKFKIEAKTAIALNFHRNIKDRHRSDE